MAKISPFNRIRLNIVGAALLMHWSCGYPLAAQAGTPREAQIAGSISDLLDQTVFSALTGLAAPSTGIRQRFCTQTDLDKLSEFSSAKNYDLVKSIYRECRIEETTYIRDNGGVVEVRFKLEVGSDRCVSLGTTILSAANDIRKIPERPTATKRFRTEEGRDLYIDAGYVYYALKRTELSYSCENNVMLITAIYK